MANELAKSEVAEIIKRHGSAVAAIDSFEEWSGTAGGTTGFYILFAAFKEQKEVIDKMKADMARALNHINR